MAKIKQGRSEAAKARDKKKDAEIEQKMIVWQREKEEQFAAEAARIEADRRAREAAKAEQKRRKQEDEAKKKRRVNSRFQRLTNTHLVGTPIGDVLAAAFNADPAADGATGGTRSRAPKGS